MSKIAANLQAVRQKVAAAVVKANLGFEPRLVAVSKQKPIEALLEAYDAGQRVFGENYVQELINKAPLMPPDAQFHMIGKLQSNKAAVVAAIPNVKTVETVDSIKLARKLNQGCIKAGRVDGDLNIFIQFNTSGEQTKGGASDYQTTVDIVKFVQDECNKLEFSGLMTIGAPGQTDDFDALKECREYICNELKIDSTEVELSMGMSGDFEKAVLAGSTSVRVGTSIFGLRDRAASRVAGARVMR